MPVIERNELLEVYTSGISAPVLMLVIHIDFLLEIEAKCICATQGRFSEGC